MYKLAVSYEGGSLAEQNLETAFMWYSRAADKGEANAQFRVGLFLDRGVACVQDRLKAHEFFKLAADNEKPAVSAFCILGRNYRVGEVVPQDLALSFHYIKLAADLGDVDSQFNVAGCFNDGAGCEQSFANAFKYYSMAAHNGDVHSMFKVGSFYYSAPPESGIIQNYDLALKYWYSASKHGHIEANGCKSFFELFVVSFFFAIVLSIFSTR